MNRALSQTAGLTLIETLITVLFLAVSITALVEFQGYMTYDNSLMQQKGSALLLASSTIESLIDFQVLNTTAGYTAWQNIASGTSTYAGTTATYTITSTVTAYANPTYKNINVAVSWTDRRGGAQSVTLNMNVAGIDFQYSAAAM